MLDKEKVIKGLDCCSSIDNNCADCPYNYDGDMGENGCLRLKLIPDALALPEEQEATKPKIYETWKYCPYCGRELIKILVYDTLKYCPHCGRELIWDD